MDDREKFQLTTGSEFHFVSNEINKSNENFHKPVHV